MGRISLSTKPMITMKHLHVMLTLVTFIGLLVLPGTVHVHPEEPVAMIVVTAEPEHSVWIQAEMISVDGESLPDRVRQTPFALEFPSSTFRISLKRSEAPVGFARGYAGPATFTATYMKKVDRDGYEGEWLGGGLVGLGEGAESVRFVVTDSTGQVGVF